MQSKTSKFKATIKLVIYKTNFPLHKMEFIVHVANLFYNFSLWQVIKYKIHKLHILKYQQSLHQAFLILDLHRILLYIHNIYSHIT